MDQAVVSAAYRFESTCTKGHTRRGSMKWASLTKPFAGCKTTLSGDVTEIDGTSKYAIGVRPCTRIGIYADLAWFGLL